MSPPLSIKALCLLLFFEGFTFKVEVTFVVFDQLYNLKESDYRMIANSIYIPSYVSFETVLRDEGVIFQRYTSIFVACKYTKTITIPVYKGLESVKVQCLKMPEELLANPLGIKTKDGYNIATLERALCDIFWKYESFYLDNLTPQMTRLSRLMEIAELYDIYKPGFKEALFTKLKVYGITATIST